MDGEEEDFLRYWFSGFVTGLEQMDEHSRDRMLRACGLACAQSYTAQVFRDAWQRSSDLKSFLVELAHQFHEAEYKYIDEKMIEVCYTVCGCDLVKLGWVASPMLCRCSAYNLQKNFELALERAVQVRLKTSILAGADKCTFEVVLLS
ncbi:MAG: hypothetical protein JW726_15950 [Anaerolineales bacterium]|nr:hypothetical protein [Anaerolineales bacterium]